MLTKRGKFYKCSLALVLSLVLFFAFSVKTAEAATSVSWTFTTGSGGGNILTYASTANPETYIVGEVGDLPGITTYYNYKFVYTFPVIMQFNQAAGADSSYRGGYINGYIYYTFVLPITLDNVQGTKSNQRFMVEFNGPDGIDLKSTVMEKTSVNSTPTYRVRMISLFNNFSLDEMGQTSNRYISLGQVKLTYEFESTLMPDPVSSAITPEVTINNSNLACTAIADAGNGIAGQIYSAIENSTSIEDIVTFLSLIEDASGDLNIAVAHINEQLLPSVISYLANIYTHTATMNQTTQNIRSYLYAISSTWPNYSAQVLFYLQQLVEMNQEQSSIAEQYQQEYASKAAQSASEAAGMQAVLPNVSASDFDIGSQLDSGTVTTLSAFWAMFPNNGLIGTMFAIAIAGIAAGYFLYGKKS